MGMALPIPQFTIDMLDHFPDDGNRYELLEGMLLVTPAPSIMHQIVATRLASILIHALGEGGKAHVVAVGAVQRGENTQLQPDILVFPSSLPPVTDWRTIQGWWLAIEVMSPSSRVYDREVKRAAHLALGVEEYWVVDMRDRSIEVWKRGSAASERVVNSLTWRPTALGTEVVVNLEEVFRDVSDDSGSDTHTGSA
jgi:Uma2 family endonuclease